ncbi:MAG: GNAT family N-acetyltransferase [Candidatus Velamenicoccus archaeovorus]
MRAYELEGPIETERLVLRPFRPDDLAALHAMHSRPDVARWTYWEPRSEDQVRELLGRKLTSTRLRSEGDVLALAAVLKRTDLVVGDLILYLASAEHQTGEIGFIVHPDHQGRGFATEAARELVRIAFEEAELHRVIGRVEARNVASARVLEKLGMRREAHLVENELVKGEWQSELIYAMLDREWAAQA